jgi:leader peptidase (prepilin peptidase)/N-methyltransferase
MIIFAGVLGLCLGSFLNVLIYRLPLGRSVVFPRSFCPNCGSYIEPLDNVPVLSYIFLKGKCRSCSQKISPIYPSIEFTTGILLVWLLLKDGVSFDFIAESILMIMVLAAAVIDFKHLIIPNLITYTMIITGLLLSFRWGLEGILIGLGGSATGILLLMAMYAAGKLMFGREAIGMGDFKFITGIGLFVGPFWSAFVILISVITGGIWGILLMITGRFEKGKEVPYGPFMAIGVFFVLFFRNQLLTFMEYYLNLF